jgi:cytochrome c-type biogenesis protein CcmF
MVPDIGLIALTIAFGMAVYATLLSVYGGMFQRPAWVASARNATLVVFGLLTVSVLAVTYSLSTLDFSQAYVADVSSQAMSPFLRITALWGGQQGSVLFWAWLMAGFVAAVVVRKWEADRELMPYVLFVAMLTTTFFIGVVLFITNPFAKMWILPGAQDLTLAIFSPAGAQQYIPQEGSGLNPLLRHFGMIGHPPTTYLGFTGFVIPFAYAIAALITGKSTGDQWIRATRRWTLVAWIFLSIGLVLGGRWAYDVLGWGGFWGWDPVENAMLMPWLTGTAFLHSVMMTEKRGMLKRWNILLIIFTYSLSLFGTFITRTGVVGSVHAFSKTALGPAFLAFISVTFLGSMVLLFKRWNSMNSEHELESFASREAAFVLQNMLFLSITIAVLWGTVFPLITELVTGTKITVGPPYFQKVTGPMFLALVCLMGITPLLAWRKQTNKKLLAGLAFPFAGSLLAGLGWYLLYPQQSAIALFALWMISLVTLSIVQEFWRGTRIRMASRGENPFLALIKLVANNRRRFGGYIIHLGVIMIALGFIGDAFFKQETQGTLAVGESLSVGQYSLKFIGLSQYPGSDGRDIVEAKTELYKNGRLVQALNPRQDYFTVQQQPVTIAGVYSTAAEDVYVLLAGWEEVSSIRSTFKIYLNPLINWVWIGGFVLAFGVLLAAWSQARGRSEATYVLKQRTTDDGLNGLAGAKALGD